jgi:predicted amidohydrolase
MSRNVTVAATQMACSWDLEGNIEVAERLVREAAAKGAQIILIQELFEAPYFCQKPNPDYLQLATTVEDNVAIKHFQKVAGNCKWCCQSASTNWPAALVSTASRSSTPTAATSGLS